MLQNGVVKLEVNSPVVHDALLDGCGHRRVEFGRLRLR